MSAPITPSLPEFRKLAEGYNLVPVWTELVSDAETPISVFQKLGGEAPSFLLESAEKVEKLGRYSVVGIGAKRTITAHGAEVTLRNDEHTTSVIGEPDPLAVVEQVLAEYRTPEIEGLPRFYGGAVGHLSFDAVRWFEPTVGPSPKDDLGVPDLYFMITEAVVVFDHLKRRVRILVNVDIGVDGIDAAYQAGVARVQELLNQLAEPVVLPPIFPDAEVEETEPESNTTREQYHAMVEKGKDYIRAGDIFQFVPSQRFSTDFRGDALALYRVLRTINPSPYMFCIRCEEGYALVGSSPEVHVRLTDGLVEIRPIAGTRRRGATDEEDAANAEDLLNDAKERAEHLMLVDLARNDVGRIVQPGSVQVTDFMTIERYSHVMHIVSHVSGQLAGGRSAYDVMRATFPAGTVSGAPKVRAMQIINEMENNKRCTYAGAVGYFGWDGNHDSCIALRTVLLEDGKAFIQAGGGVVADSTPEGEYQETINKAMAMVRAVERARQVGEA